MAARLAELLPLALLLAAAGCSAAQPLRISLLTPTVPETEGNGWLQVDVTDAAGQRASNAAVHLKSAVGPGGELASDVQLWLNDNKSFGLDFRKLQPKLGLYTLIFSASTGDASGEATAQVAATGAIEVGDATAGVQSGDARNMQPVTYPQPLPETLSLHTDAAAKAVFAFTVRRAADGLAAGESFRPHQAFVRATHVDSGVAAYFRAKAGDAGAHRATFSAADIAGQTDGRGGLYDLTLLVGDAAATTPIEWRLGQVDVPAQRSDAVAAPSVPRPRIVHQFRAPEKPPPAVIPVFFAGLQVALFLGLVYVLFRISGGALKGFPRTAGGALAAIGFHAGLLGLLALYLQFWVRLRLLQLAPLLAAGGFVTAVFGYFALSHLASRSPPA